LLEAFSRLSGRWGAGLDDETNETGVGTIPGVRCNGCGAEICGRQQVISRILGGKDRVSCLECLGTALGASPEQLCDLVGKYLAGRQCYRDDWRAASVCDSDGQAACCPSRLEQSPVPPAWCRTQPSEDDEPDAELPTPDLVVDAEEAGCGDLMVLLMRSIRKLDAGDVLRFTARDPGAAADIPSWCRLTGHPLLAGPVDPEGATYYIRRKLS
jgi:tRNA 2-thiouridine synthesizing protein A